MSVARICELEEGVAKAIRSHGEETFPHECCGALVGRGDRVTAAVPLPNTTEEGPRRRFLVRPGDYRLAEQQASELGAELLGFYHSHPDHPARPSQFDLDHAWPTFAYVIVSVMSGQARDMTVWFLLDDRSRFDEGKLNGDQNPDSDSAPAVHR
ncbi:MAG: Mov34/MPN/PAD-1 family protein [Vicinamibacterales bacterium]